MIKVPADSSTTVTLYVLVSRRGSRDQVFTDVGKSIFPGPPGPVDVKTSPHFGELKDCQGAETFSPSVWISAYSPGALNGSTIQYEWPKIGSQGIGANSGTVFRQTLASTFDKAGATPTLMSAGEEIITTIPPDGWPDSPLIYIYQTQLSF